tara:strand:- start:1039 stop:1407 length:369 start_codon:yes stop_codon:yes gene_type:complete
MGKGEKVGLLDKIMNAFKEQSEKKVVARVLKKASRIIGETIYDAEKQVERLSEKIADKKEDLDSAYLTSIDPVEAKGNEEDHAKYFLDGIKTLKKEIASFEDQLEEQQNILDAAEEELAAIS